MFNDLETPRLRLKNIGPEDREFIYRQFTDDFVNRYLFDAEPLASLKEADRLIAFFSEPEPKSRHRWVLVEKAGGEKIGTCGFHCWDREQGTVEVGYDLREAYCRQGLMTEALRAILPLARRELGVSRIDASIYTGNAASAALAEKLGFRFLGETKDFVFRGKRYPHRIYSLRVDGSSDGIDMGV